MPKIEFSKQERAAIVSRIQLYFNEALDREIGQFDADFLLDIFTEEIGPHFYNRGLYDARAVIEKRLESVDEALYEIELPTGVSK
jgi:uncharacterized protein (DUF2164 family)